MLPLWPPASRMLSVYSIYFKPGAVGQGSKLRHDKCVSFPWWKKNNQYQQILPSLFIFDKSIPQVPLGGEFKYLGRTFGFDIKFHSMHKYLEDKLNNMLSITAKLKISVQLKLRIFFTIHLKPGTFWSKNVWFYTNLGGANFRRNVYKIHKRLAWTAHQCLRVWSFDPTQESRWIWH